MNTFLPSQIGALQEFSFESGTRPLPRMKPMLASRKDGAFDHPDWIFEIRNDGCRAIAVIHNSFVQLYNRHFASMNSSCPEILEMLKKMEHTVILDGVIVSSKKGETTIQTYHVFDIVHLNGFDLFEVPLIRRKELLKSVLENRISESVVYTEHIRKNGLRLFDEAANSNCNGIIARNAHSPYRAGRRTQDWFKIKVLKQQEVYIAGFTSPKEDKSFFDSLILAVKNGNRYEYVGMCSKGFTEKSIEKIYNKLAPHFTSLSPFTVPMKFDTRVQWLKPKVSAEIRYAEKSGSGRLRSVIYSKLITSKVHKENFIQNRSELGATKKGEMRASA